MIWLFLFVLVGESGCKDDFSFTEKYCSSVMECCYGPSSHFQIAFEIRQHEERSANSILMQLTGKRVEQFDHSMTIYESLSLSLTHTHTLVKESDRARKAMRSIFIRFAFLSNTTSAQALASISTIANAFQRSSTLRPQSDRKKWPKAE